MYTGWVTHSRLVRVRREIMESLHFVLRELKSAQCRSLKDFMKLEYLVFRFNGDLRRAKIFGVPGLDRIEKIPESFLFAKKEKQEAAVDLLFQLIFLSPAERIVVELVPTLASNLKEVR